MTTVESGRGTGPDGHVRPESGQDEPGRPRRRFPGLPRPSRLPRPVAFLWATLRRPVPAALVTAAVLHVLWLLLLANEGGDLAAQDAWAEFAGRHPDTAYSFAWYGGMHPVSYSVISPYLMAVLGVRTTMVLAGTLSAGVLALILVRCGAVRRPMLPALWGTVSLVGNAASGRVTFGLGLLFGLIAVALVFPTDAPPSRRWGPRRRGLRLSLIVLATALATAASPVAGLFLEVVAAALFLQRRRTEAYALGLAPPVVVAASALLFPFQGVQPMPWVSGLLPLTCAIAVWFLVPSEWRTVRIGTLIYGLGTLLTWIIPSQVGSNVERMALIFAGPVLLAALDTARSAPRFRRIALSRLAVVWLAFAGIAGWTIAKPVIDMVLTSPDAAWNRELAPLIHQLRKVDTEEGRVEVVPVRSHREASAFQPYVFLARGWNRQADTDKHAVFYDGTLTPVTYRDWLQRWAVRYVVLPVEDRPDTGGHEEAEIVAAGQPYLREIWKDSNWRLFQVKNPTPLVEPPASALRADEKELVVTVEARGPVLVRVPWSPWLALVDEEGKAVDGPEVVEDDDSGDSSGRGVREVSDEGTPFYNRNGCLTEAGDWTLLHAPGPGTYHISSPYKVPRGTTCPD